MTKAPPFDGPTGPCKPVGPVLPVYPVEPVIPVGPVPKVKVQSVVVPIGILNQLGDTGLPMSSTLQAPCISLYFFNAV